MTATTLPALAVNVGPRLRPDPSRTIARLFVPGEELPDGSSRGHRVIDRVLALDDVDVARSMATVTEDFAGRHRDLGTLLDEHFAVATYGRPDLVSLTKDRRRLIGAYFTMEYAVEGAALFNPSMVPHPDQRGLRPGQVRFVMSLRAVGEGHLSSVEFRTGIIGPGPALSVDPPGHTLTMAAARPGTCPRDLVLERMAELGADQTTVAAIVGELPEEFDAVDLRRAIDELHPHLQGRPASRVVIDQIVDFADGEYLAVFPPETGIGERLLWPHTARERHGLEDVRMVRFVDDDGSSCYYGTYTAYDGSHIAPQLLRTEDFTTFRVGQLAGYAARDKGMALFPRRVVGRYMALSRWDRESVSLCVSDDNRIWYRAETLAIPHDAWQIVQLGNCGSPIETEQGWLLLIHGVGPMRTYGIGAILLDLNDPATVSAVLREPLLWATGEERNGYVPNVAYSCGAMRHDETITIPYGISDSCVGFAQVHLPSLLDRMQSPDH
jgi:predicted GH43/DUF377 family glycosyl hydrolase